MPADKEIFFGGAIDSISALHAIPFKKKEGIHNWVDVYEQAFFQLTSTDEGKQEYGDPDKGATLEQAWRASSLLTGKPPVCLLATDKPSVAVAAIEKLVRLNSSQLVDVLKELFELLGDIGISILYYDGKIGHSVCLESYDETASRFTYLDPWPEFSLLSKEYNAAGIDAQRIKGNIWSLTDEELQRVIFSAFVLKQYWAAYNGEKFTLLLEELQKSDFWTFFHLGITGKEKTKYGIEYKLKTGGFQDKVDLTIGVNENGEVSESKLYVNRDWLLGPPWGVNPYAQDIIRNFILGTVPPPDREGWVTEMQTFFTPQSIGDYLEQYHKNPDVNLPNGDVAMVFLGMPEATIPLQFSSVNFSNLEFNNIERFVITITIDNV